MARKRKHPEHVNHERWLVSYADFITLLFAFFTAMYAISTVDAKKLSSMEFTNLLLEQANVVLTPGSGFGTDDSRAIVPDVYIHKVGDDYVITKKSRFHGIEMRTHEYPGFSTDLQAPFTILMTQAEGQSLIFETIFEGRLFYTDKLTAMGANIIMCDPHRVIVNGPSRLVGKKLESPDLRAGWALVLAGLIAYGETTIENVYQIERGYENIVQRLKSLGAKITES